MINNVLLKKVLKSLNIDIPNDDKSVLNLLNEMNIFEDDFSSCEYSSLIKIREYILGFTNRLMYSYSKPIQEIEIFVELCKTIGDNIIKRNYSNDSSQLIALKRLHQKSSLVSSEIIYLIKGGYASAALSRWRTLLEVSIISLFLALNDDVVSERYLDYIIIDTKKEMNNYNENVEFLGFEDIPLTEQNKVMNEYDNILKKYGNDFKNNNAWASEVLNNKKPNLHDLMNYVNLEYMKPFYKLSNNFIHSGSKSLMFNLGYINGVDGDNTISSRSNIGFTDPAQLCMLSFFNSTMAFLSVSPNEEDLIILLSLYNKINRISNKFSDAENKLFEES